MAWNHQLVGEGVVFESEVQYRAHKLLSDANPWVFPQINWDDL